MATVFVEILMLKDAPAIIGSDLNTYGPFFKDRVYAIPKENARLFIKQGVAVATRKEAEKPTLKEMFKGEVLTPYIEAAVTRPLFEEPKNIGYRVHEPEETKAIDVIKFEVQELGNDHMLTDVAKALGTGPDLYFLENAISLKFGADAVGMWLCKDPKWAKKRYGPGDLYEVKIPSDALVGSDLGDDGQFWIWRKQPIESKLIEEPEVQKNWVVVVQTKEAKKHFYSIGTSSLEEAERVATNERLKLLRENKDRWYEVVIKPPPEEAPNEVVEIKRKLLDRLKVVKKDVAEEK